MLKSKVQTINTAKIVKKVRLVIECFGSFVTASMSVRKEAIAAVNHMREFERACRNITPKKNKAIERDAESCAR